MKTTIIFILTLLLTACAAPTLEERLAGKTGPDRMKTLYHACIQRSDYSVPGGHSKDYIGHESRQWKLCDRMYEASKNHASQEIRADLAKECGTEISKGFIPDHPANVRHFENMRTICQEMTGLSVTLAKEK